MPSKIPDQPAHADLAWFLAQARPRKLRTIRRFAEEEIVLPNGPFAGRRFRCDRQPYTGLWLDQIDSGGWTRFVATGPTQSGKTVACFVIPLLYHLFEVGETVICGLPDMDMARDKWIHDLLPMIERSRYRDLLPAKGSGSRGGLVQSIRFRNNVSLRFMSGGGGDKSRAGFTARVVVISETDGMDEPGKTSREADKVAQLIARTRAYGNRARIYMECTVSTEGGRTWREYKGGSASQIVLPCPHCNAWVAPERDHLAGWQEAESHTQARRTASFFCPGCGEAWSEGERIAANRGCRLLHAGQTIDDGGNIVGSRPETDTLGFRWSAAHNLFLSPGELGADEWRAARAPDEENAEREMRQFVWCLPVASTRQIDAEIAAQDIASRTRPLARGIVPHDAQWVTVAMDLGKYLDHWVAVAWSPGPFAHVVDYGRIEVPTGDLAVEQASMVALRQFRELALAGWPRGNPEGEKVIPKMVWVDAGYMTDIVYAFCRESRGGFHPAVGRGVSQQRQQWYNRPTSTGAVVRQIGEGYHVNWIQASGVYLIEVNSDHWKTFVHQRLCSPLESPGSMTLFQAPPQEHLALAKHLTAEAKVEEFIAGKGVVTRWERKRKSNHWLDALYNACAAGHWCGVRMVKEILPPSKAAPAPQERTTRSTDDRPWFDHERWLEGQRRFWQRRGW